MVKRIPVSKEKWELMKKKKEVEEIDGGELVELNEV